MVTALTKISAVALRLLLKPDNWKYDSYEYCPSCNRKSIIVYSYDGQRHISEITSTWESGSDFKELVIKRENYFCHYCNANYRVRANAESVLRLLGMPSSEILFNKLSNNTEFRIYETAVYNVFRSNKIKKLPNYTVSEFFDSSDYGSYVNGIRNENLEYLTFPDSTFDIVINCDVLEHVSDLNKALFEIKRVLKPGGFHVFTLPVDHKLPKTRERAKVVNGTIEHLLKPVMHGDSIRRQGVLAFRDFGSDVLQYVSRDGFESKEHAYLIDNQYVTSVYYAQKM